MINLGPMLGAIVFILGQVHSLTLWSSAWDYRTHIQPVLPTQSGSKQPYSNTAIPSYLTAES